MKGKFDNFSDHEILEMLLFYAVPYKDTNEMAHKMINEFGKLHALMDADPMEIMNKCGVSEYIAILIAMVVPMYKRYAMGRWEKKTPIDTSAKAGQYAISIFAGETSECFYVICLDKLRKLISAEMIVRGTVDEAQIYMRHVVETALKHNSASVILAHNHPAASLVASQNDIVTTKKIVAALEPLRIEVIDHIIVAGESYLSFSEKRLLNMVYD